MEFRRLLFRSRAAFLRFWNPASFRRDMMTISPLMPVYPRCDVRPVRGDGCYLIDESGKRFLDFASGIAVNILGHSHPHLISAIQNQAATLLHGSNNRKSVVEEKRM